MPTKNPRLSITLEPSLAAQLRRLSELTGNSQSALISELLDGSASVFDRMIQVLEAANDVKASIKGNISGDLHVAQERMERQLGLSLDTFDAATKPLLEEAEKVRRRARRAVLARDVRPAAVSASSTPMSNRGVRSSQKKSDSPVKRRG